MANHRRPACNDLPEDSETRSSKQLGVRVPTHINDQLEAIAKRESNGVSAVVRRLLTAALAEPPEAA
jgi:predicted HicB family RNase H-like nuclease